MNILDPTVGDLIDRRMILALKLQKAGLPHWADEAKAIDRRLKARRGPVPPAGLEVELRAVHQAMWAVNNRLAAIARQAGPPLPNFLGIEMWTLNQRRIALIAAINTAVGYAIVPEKAYDL